MRSPIPLELIERHVHRIRGRNVLVDFDLAKLYGVPLRAIRQAVWKHKSRFPKDFIFKLASDEVEALAPQSISHDLRGSGKHAVYAFKEPGILMLSAVIKSDRAVQINIELIRSLFSFGRIF